MDPYVALMLGLAAIWLSGPLIALALVVLWLKSRSSWLLLALSGECVSYGFRVVWSTGSAAGNRSSMAEWILPIAALMVATGFLGYALSARHARAGRDIT